MIVSCYTKFEMNRPAEYKAWRMNTGLLSFRLESALGLISNHKSPGELKLIDQSTFTPHSNGLLGFVICILTMRSLCTSFPKNWPKFDLHAHWPNRNQVFMTWPSISFSTGYNKCFVFSSILFLTTKEGLVREDGLIDSVYGTPRKYYNRSIIYCSCLSSALIGMYYCSV